MSEDASTEIPEKLDESVARILAEGDIVNDLITPDKIYVDLAMLKDLYIGTLLSFLIEPISNDLPKLSGDAGYKYVLSQIANYRKRSFNDMAFYFPDLGITSEMVHERMYDPNYSDLIYSCSPASSFLDTFWAQLAVNVNHSAVSGKKDPILVTVNTFPLKLNAQHVDLLGAFVVVRYGVNVAPIYIDPKEMSISQFESFEEYYVYHYKPFSDRADVQKLFHDMRMIKKRLFVPKYFGYEFNALLNLENAARINSGNLSTMIQFKYLDMSLVSVPIPVEKS